VNELTNKEIEDATTSLFQRKALIKSSVNAFGLKWKDDFKEKKYPSIVQINKKYWINPLTFSNTKSKNPENGYPTVPLKIPQREPFLTMKKEKSTSSKSTWVPRVLIHLLIWRFEHKSKIGDGMEISHVRGQVFLTGKGSVEEEDGIINKSRSACIKFKWYKRKFACVCKKDCSQLVVKCPHTPMCGRRVKITRRKLDIFSNPKTSLVEYADFAQSFE
jgi:hypothetical protein